MCKNHLRLSILNEELKQRLVEFLPDEYDEDIEDEEAILLSAKETHLRFNDILLFVFLSFLVYGPIYHLCYYLP